MKHILPLVLWIVLLFNSALSQFSSRKNLFGNRHEVFFLNLEDGYFGCQVNESVEFLQIYELSRLCDGLQDCYMGSDELRKELKCTNDCESEDGSTCSNGVCLDHLCHCNDGFGGCNCQVPDENECKYRPCDVFAHCTNTLGSFTCTCFPGYVGDGLHCEDIDECQDPSIAARCVENAECCNLPANFACKCKPGFEGDGEERCTDINECARPGACGINAECHNSPGNFTCSCIEGFEGNPYDGCADLDECAHPEACGSNAICTNLEGGHRCDCPEGFDGDARSTGCVDYNECARSPCGRNAHCANEVGTFRCYCPEGFVGDAMTECQDINECHDNPCGQNAVCQDTPGSFSCSCLPDFTGDPFKGCVDIDECSALEKPCGNFAICENSSPGYNCICPQGYRAKPDAKIACEQADVNILCHSNFDCTNNAECIEGQCFCQEGFEASGSVCVDIDECQTSPNACGDRANCLNIPGSFKCQCDAGFIGTPPRVPCKAPCEDVKCGSHAFCKPEGNEAFCICEEGWTFLPTDISKGCVDINECDESHGPSGLCGINALCSNRDGAFDCSCPPGFSGDPFKQCFDINECTRQNACGENALCQNSQGSYTCVCPEGTVADPDPTVRCIAVVSCQKSSDCPGNAICDPYKRCLCPEPNVGNDCRHPCEQLDCGPNSQCRLEKGSAKCFCTDGFSDFAGVTYLPPTEPKDCRTTGCIRGGDCVQQGSKYVCRQKIACKSHEQCASQKACINSRCGDPCALSNPCSQNQECQVLDHQPVCVKVCQCQKQSDCRGHAVCNGCDCIEQRDPIQHDGCAHCPQGVKCDPTTGACINEPGMPKRPGPCNSDNDCIESEACYMGQCEDPCQFREVCATNAICQVKMHRPICMCPKGHEGNPAINCTTRDLLQCTVNEDCSLTEACIQNVCQPPCDVRNPCAEHAVCINVNHGSDCSCVENYHGNGYVGCQLVDNYVPVCQYNEDCPPDKFCDRLNRICINPCLEDSCGDGAECIPENHGFTCKCPAGYDGNAYIECSRVTGCKSDRECPSSQACINTQCSSPCQCGVNAECIVKNHKASCKCPTGYTGNPLEVCGPPSDPCDPNPCGTHALCELDRGNPICYCPKGMTGNPFQACIPEGGQCEKNSCGPNSGCRVIDGKPRCFCLPGFEGNPPRKQCGPPQSPCDPSPCGPNTQCSIQNGIAKCSCISGFIESPNTIRGCVEPLNPCDPNPCGHGAMCDASRNPNCYCPGSSVGNPFRQCVEPVVVQELCKPGPCARNADCFVVQNREQCYCRSGFVGDPYNGCQEPPKSICQPNPCGPNAQCLVSPDGKSMCVCPEGLGGDPTSLQGCHGYECQVDDECNDNRACIGFKCQDPCPGSCGHNAYCRVEKHHPVCFCNSGLTGNPLQACYHLEERDVPKDPCNPTPCGINTVCKIQRKKAVCSCIKDFLGSPQDGCRPECVLNSDCPTTKACVNQKCVEPCAKEVCGINSQCRVYEHVAVCQCPAGYIGDAFYQCTPIPHREEKHNPCDPSPCGPNVPCQIFGDNVAICDICSSPEASLNPQCRPECLSNSECPFDKACLGQKCIDPCPGSCGYNAYCEVINHNPICRCNEGLVGNPFEQCSHPVADEGPVTCDNILCGANTECTQKGKVFKCVCRKGFYGDPLIGCRPECVINTDCPVQKACRNYKCENPCEGACGRNSLCEVINHYPVCYCPPNHSGDALVSCNEIRITPIVPLNPCDPSPCGPNSRCLITSNVAVCSCLPTYKGSPPFCQPECIVSSECSLNKACDNQRCIDPCPGTCGANAECQVVNHNPICSCPKGLRGDPFVACQYFEEPISEDREVDRNPCIPSPCGQNSVCQVKQNRPVCSCIENFIGKPPYCRPECILNSECPQDKACIREKCADPCANACGPNAECHVVAHSAYCNCLPGYEGDSFVGCQKIFEVTHDSKNPCYPSPCGENAECSVYNNAAKCSCIPPYRGDPYSTGCRPECILNADCPSQLACVNQYCRDPCPGVCGSNAECSVANHIPICSCSRGFNGDPFNGCKKEIPVYVPPTNVCEPSPCGPNSLCRVVDGRPACSCIAGYIGAPPQCRPECIVSSECDSQKACIRQKCVDPCPGTCGVNANCQVRNHNPICSCPPKYVGDPFVQCTIKPKEEPRKNPCVPSPCGPNSQCTANNDRATCLCVAGMFGAPPNCRPECTINQDCPSNRACFNQKCADPCVGSCGFNAICNVQNHQPICNCFDGYEGDPYSGCNVKQSPPVEEKREPCNPSPCGANAECKERNGAGSCSCLPEYYGDPYTGCRPECVQNSDCDRSKACVNNKCKDPCPGVCGINAECRVQNHAPICLCLIGYEGDPTRSCSLVEITTPKPIENPCKPSPCGPNSQCREINNHAICSCIVGYIGIPPMCRPECVVSSECSLNKACINEKCVDPCPGTCGDNARCNVVNHNPICSCAPGFTGDPFTGCHKLETPILREPENPCIPSPCGPNSQCRVIGSQAACSCLPNYIGQSPNCRPECTINAECPSNLACINEKCSDPCPGSCGVNARCSVINHNAVCTCVVGYEGDPTIQCSPIPSPSTEQTPIARPCDPSPCGPNAECRENNGAGACFCFEGYEGNPFDNEKGCRRECESNNDCSDRLACVRNKCIDPCVGTCGSYAICDVQKHVPLCTCPAGYTGDPFFLCREEPRTPPPRTNPCVPSPCGPNSQCREVNSQGVCSCLPNYIGSPPGCRPECVVNSECSDQMACVNQKCADPCPNTCGVEANCKTLNHNPICSCPNGYTGDPFARCSRIPIQRDPEPVEAPSCEPSPCGPNAKCQLIGGNPACSCLPNYIGAPPNCRPECVLNAECPSQEACINQKCKDPCVGSCGIDAECRVQNHVPICTCPQGYEGDPFAGCRPIPATTERPIPRDLCNPSPCGPNAQCSNGICSCLAEYHGDPYTGCRPECVLNNDCPRNKACLRNKCVDPCPGVCGENARCEVINHIPTCSCNEGYEGNAFARCTQKLEEPKIQLNPCQPSPCGQNSQCRNVNDRAVCTCLPEYIGAPPSCRPECVLSSECSQDKACVNRKCIDPCPGTCGFNARCEVINHSPICSCPAGQTGDPFRSCFEIPPVVQEEERKEPCVPSPCGPNSQCTSNGPSPVCQCIAGYIGKAPNCRPECTINSDCPSDRSCINQKCTNPCPEVCGTNAECRVISHTISCTCPDRFTGNPFVQCIPQTIREEPINPCEPSPCGPNAECIQRNGVGSCKCIPEYFGNPYEGCRPECVLNSDCSSSLACIRNKCADPCPGICGQNAECRVINHVPTCSCLNNFVGDPFTSCQLVRQEPITQPPVVNPCNPSPCGPNSQCREVNKVAVCSCTPEYVGSPPNCRPECTINSECPIQQACHNYKCKNPCRGTCGVDAICEVINHNPICSCRSGYTGDPFVRCQVSPKVVEPAPRPKNPCVPSPCGLYAECRPIGDSPSCSCIQSYIGSPPNCRPECVVNTDCQSSQACINEKCKDPCNGACGFNTECHVQNHIPVCSCQTGFTGDPFTQCVQVVEKPPPRDIDPCNPSPCGANSQCSNGICSCLPEYQGDPYSGCRPECVLSTECSPTKACIRNKCVDPCPGTCGQNALCNVINHIPACSCPQGMTGDAFTQCKVIPETKRPENPCSPSPCGPNSVCRANNGLAVCSCQPGMIGGPPSCRPECIVSSECDLSKSCMNQKCIDPCPGSCGENAQCRVINHNPVCSCINGYTGDPFSRCSVIYDEPKQQTNPCIPSPCGPNSQCKVVGESPACSCALGMIGNPPNCRPECTINNECSSSLACINQKCKDPCPGACGPDSQCSVINHNPICTCDIGFTGDPFYGCQRIIAPPTPPAPKTPCQPSPCGANAHCRVVGDQATCECIPEYHGNPFIGCRPECISNSECSRNLACINNKCKDPCIGTCGIEAVCTVFNHIPTCSCPPGTTGDAFRQCESIRKYEPPVEKDPCYPSPCKTGSVCRRSGSSAVCECIPGYFGDPYQRGCYPECTINSDCPLTKSCTNYKCVDPCLGEICGYNAKCSVINHSPICACPEKMIGDPFVECKPVPEKKDPCYPSPCAQNGICRVVNGVASCQYPECVQNDDCPTSRACFNQKCGDPCHGACGIDALCNVINHKAVCSCPRGYVGSPFQQCSKLAEPLPRPECTSDDECSNDKACINQKCVNPCTASNGICGVNAECHVQSHRPLCVCRSGFTGNAQYACYEIGCRSDSECPPTEACVNKECTDPCKFTQCGRNAACKSDYNHKARCHCFDGYRGNPLVSCERPECTSNDECPYHLACQKERCVDPCNCAPSAQCNVINHIPSCRCPPGHTGNPSKSCELVRFEEPRCRMDADCPSKQACFSGECKNPCIETKPCGANAICSVVDSLPLRTMVCTCIEGFVGDAEKECKPAPRDEPGCKSDNDCPDTESCRNGLCLNPCIESNPCARTAQCSAKNHRAQCSCPADLIGDPFVNCYKEPVSKVECTHDTDCSVDTACINKRCQNPCAESNPCAQHAECRISYHRPLCYCPPGWGGDPQRMCYKPECRSDDECPYDKACYNEKCLNPCSQHQCGKGAQCLAQQHRANCICPAGTQGNPLVSCITGLCQYNEDCADHEACDRLNRVCRPVCDDQSCGTNAFCKGQKHQPTCHCRDGTMGNPFVECLAEKSAPRPECTVDAECPSQLACINQHCENPCIRANICTRDQTCEVLDTIPLRTLVCKCPSDQITDANGNCKPIVRDACTTHEDCPDSDQCVRGSCLLACKVEPCGLNAQCLSQRHRAICSCAPEYQGNPHIECSFIQREHVPHAECYHDDDCPLDRTCNNEKCVNPCSLRNSCGRGAFCHAEKHQSVCRCPVGYNGNPEVSCSPPEEPKAGCRSNSECQQSESCVNDRCVSPCNCGQNADCLVANHHPVCTCKPGYSGNPQFGCFKLGCESDSQCTDDKTCYNGQCVNPCSISDPCAISATCYGSNHRSACKCPPGLEGNPLVKCERAECYSDFDCPNVQACSNKHCINPCKENNPCASNAICFVSNHNAKCRCPESLPEGNPFSYCSAPKRDHEPECRIDGDCPSQLACIDNTCKNPCIALSPCARTARCDVLDSLPVRTMICSCPEHFVPDSNGECKKVVPPVKAGCSSDSECSEKEACINSLCRNPCNCGTNAECIIKGHRAICSCAEGYEGNPDIACRTVGCRSNSECESEKACINANCVNPCLIDDPCGLNAECFVRNNQAECRCRSGYRGNPRDVCRVVGCQSNNDCPSDKRCVNEQCINPCLYENPCSPRAECHAQNHLAVCKCPPGLFGNPYIDCKPEVKLECEYDTDCSSTLACINNKCKDPCVELAPCNLPAKCQVIPSNPVRTMICICPEGYISSGSGTCKPIESIRVIGCIADSDCGAEKSCINSICRDPCNCGQNALCRIKGHKPVCTCEQGYDGNPEIGCVKIGCTSDDECSGQHTCINRQCVPVCSAEKCGTRAECTGINHRAICDCPPGFSGDPKIACTLLGCRSDSECPLDKACINSKCENPCEKTAKCDINEICNVYNHRPECSCPPGFVNDPKKGCILYDTMCHYDGDCQSQTACIGGECVNPCNATEPCGVNSICKVLDTLPVRTMVCECLPGYQGNAAIQCDKRALCTPDKVTDDFGRCVCPPGTALNIYEECIVCEIHKGFKVDETGHCVCALDRGLIIDERGRCVCPEEHGYKLTSRGDCILTAKPECESDNECPDYRFCDLSTKTCEDPCERNECGVNAFCNATNHKAICQCITGYTGDAYVYCNQTNKLRTDFPRPEMAVSCLADGVQVEIHLAETGFNGVLYVKGHSKDEECRRVINLSGDTTPRTEIFKVHFGSCGLFHVNGLASFVLVIQKHPKLVTYKAQAYQIRCVYQTGEQNVTLGFNVQMLTTAGTIANTGPPPQCSMRIVRNNGDEINSAEIGDNLMLQVEVQPATIYGGFARSCVAKTMEENVENEYIVTDENGCATDPSIFGEWDYNSDSNTLMANFNAFKFPSSDNIRFQCNIRVCFGKCQPVNCRGANAFGRRRRREITDESNKQNNSVATRTTTDDLGIEGTLREEITISSNAILTFEKRDGRYSNSDNLRPAAQRVEDICVSMIGLIIALIITALLALVAVAIAVSCWLMAYRRRPKTTGPLPHPPEFPNPLFTNPDGVSEPSPDYLS